MALTNLNGIGHIGFKVKDMEATKKFYCEVLGFKVIWYREFEKENIGLVKMAFFELGNLRFEVSCVPGREYPTDGVFQHVAIATDNIEEVYKQLKALNIECTEICGNKDMLEGGSRWVNIKGPNGETIEFAQVG